MSAGSLLRCKECARSSALGRGLADKKEESVGMGNVRSENDFERESFLWRKRDYRASILPKNTHNKWEEFLLCVVFEGHCELPVYNELTVLKMEFKLHTSPSLCPKGGHSQAQHALLCSSNPRPHNRVFGARQLRAIQAPARALVQDRPETPYFSPPAPRLQGPMEYSYRVRGVWS